jgi:hypothetical protein
MSKRKQRPDDSIPHSNEEEVIVPEGGVKKNKKKMKKARKAAMEEQTAQMHTKKRKIGAKDEENGKTTEKESDYTDHGPKGAILQGATSANQEKEKKTKKKKGKKKAKKDSDDADKSGESKKKKKKKDKKKKQKKEKQQEKTTNDNAGEKEEKEPPAKEEKAAPSADSAGWNDWQASSFEDEQRKSKFLRLMGAKKPGAQNQPPKGKGLFGSLRPSEPSAINATTAEKITHDLASQFDSALQRRNFRGGLGIDTGSKKSDHSTGPHPGKGASKLYIDTQPKSVKFDD